MAFDIYQAVTSRELALTPKFGKYDARCVEYSRMINFGTIQNDHRKGRSLCHLSGTTGFELVGSVATIYFELITLSHQRRPDKEYHIVL